MTRIRKKRGTEEKGKIKRDCRRKRTARDQEKKKKKKKKKRRWIQKQPIQRQIRKFILYILQLYT